MRPVDADVPGIKGKGIAAFDPVPLKALQKELGHYGVAVIGIENVHLRRDQAGPLVHPRRRPVRPFLDFGQIGLGSAELKVVLGMVQHIDRRCFQGPGPLGSGEQVSRRRIHRAVAVPNPQGVQDVAGTDIVLHRDGVNAVIVVETPGGQHSVLVLIDDKGGQVVVLPAVFQAILVMGKDVDEIVAAVIAPRHGPLAGAAGIVVGIFAAAAVAAGQVAGGVNHQASIADPIAYGLGRHSHHFSDGRHAGGGKLYIRQAHRLDQPIAVDQGQSVFGIVGRVKVGARRPAGGGAAAAAGNVAVAADYAVNLFRGHAGVGHSPLASQDGIGPQALLQSYPVPAAIHRRMAVAGNGYLAAVFPNPQAVFIPPPRKVAATGHCRSPAIHESAAPELLPQSTLPPPPLPEPGKPAFPAGWNKS